MSKQPRRPFGPGIQSLYRPLMAVAAAGLVLGLTACEQDSDDLDRYIREVNQRPGGEIEPLPQIEAYEGFTYSVQDQRSPFQPDSRMRPEEETRGDGDGPAPDFDRRREFLERYPLDGLRLQGTLEMQGQLFAIVRDPEGTVHRVTVGNYLGENHGEVVAINENRITLRELVPDGTGGWNERERRISLSD